MRYSGVARVMAAAAIAALVAGGTLFYARTVDPGFVSRASTRLGLAGATDLVPTPGVADVVVDAGSPGQPISPLIYGVAFADGPTLERLGATVDRWGGNSASRYNWVAGAWNAARDWEFRNMPAPGADEFIAGALDGHATPLMTVPTLGWVARDSNNATASEGVPAGGGPASTAAGAIKGYDPGPNRKATSVPSFARKPGPLGDPPDPSAPVVYQDEWIHHLVNRFGPGTVRLYAADNEPDLWSLTHTDVHPAEMGYDDMARNFTEYATAIKDQDRRAAVIGPELCCWTSLFYSALDRGQDNFRTHADRNAHQGTPFLPWWLAQVARQDRARGSRSLDIVSVHFYPQADGAFGDAADPRTQALRVRSVRSLWDPTYTDESWIADQVQLIPRLKQWIAENYPGTGLGITEYNFGGQGDASGAVAQAEALGIFGALGVQLATTWTHPSPDSPAGAAFRLFRNFDGAGATFGDAALPVRGGGSARAFAARHSDTGEIDVVVANESLTSFQQLSVRLAGSGLSAREAYSVNPGSSQIERRPAAGGALKLPPLGIALVRFVK